MKLAEAVMLDSISSKMVTFKLDGKDIEVWREPQFGKRSKTRDSDTAPLS